MGQARALDNAKKSAASDKRLRNALYLEDRLMEALQQRMQALSAVAAMACNGDGEQKLYGEKILAYLIEIAKSDEWDTNISQVIVATLLPLVEQGNLQVLKFISSSLSSGLPAGKQKKIEEILSKKQPASKIAAMLRDKDIVSNERLGYLMLCRNQDSQAFLEEVVKDEKLDIRFRLYAFTCYNKNLVELQKNKKFHVDSSRLVGMFEMLKGGAEKLVAARFHDNEKIEGLFSNPVFANEEYKVYLTAVMVTLENHLASVDESGFSRIINGIYSGVLYNYYDNANAGLVFGARLLEGSPYKAALFFAVAAHELGHCILYYGHDYNYRESLKFGILDELVADEHAAFLMNYFGIDPAIDREAMNFMERLTDVESDNYNAVEDHEGARAQKLIIESEMAGFGHEYDHVKFIQAALKIVPNKDFAYKSLEEIMKAILLEYFGYEEPKRPYSRYEERLRNSNDERGSAFDEVDENVKIKVLTPDKVREIVDMCLSGVADSGTGLVARMAVSYGLKAFGDSGKHLPIGGIAPLNRAAVEGGNGNRQPAGKPAVEPFPTAASADVNDPLAQAKEQLAGLIRAFGGYQDVELKPESIILTTVGRDGIPVKTIVLLPQDKKPSVFLKKARVELLKVNIKIELLKSINALITSVRKEELKAGKRQPAGELAGNEAGNSAGAVEGQLSEVVAPTQKNAPVKKSKDAQVLEGILKSLADMLGAVANGEGGVQAAIEKIRQIDRLAAGKAVIHEALYKNGNPNYEMIASAVRNFAANNAAFFDLSYNGGRTVLMARRDTKDGSYTFAVRKRSMEQSSPDATYRDKKADIFNILGEIANTELHVNKLMIKAFRVEPANGVEKSKQSAIRQDISGGPLLAKPSSVKRAVRENPSLSALPAKEALRIISEQYAPWYELEEMMSIFSSLFIIRLVRTLIFVLQHDYSGLSIKERLKAFKERMAGMKEIYTEYKKAQNAAASRDYTSEGWENSEYKTENSQVLKKAGAATGKTVRGILGHPLF